VRVEISDFPLTSSLDCDLTVLAEVDSTNSYLRDHPGLPGVVTVVVTDNQTAGRGRAGRVWMQPAGSGLAVSIRLPVATVAKWVSAFPLLVGGVVADMIGRHTGLVASVKWPNDVLVSGKKVAGVLCETTDDGVIAGVGINLMYPEESLPTPQATSLHLHTDVDPTLPDRLVSGIVTGLVDVVEQASRGHLETLLHDVSSKTATIGQRVRVDFPDSSSRVGTARGIGSNGSLQVVWSDGTDGAVIAGDVWHVTPLPNDVGWPNQPR
jgi:BirA family biotin operon repressor/biotin-[acetyl-CoA-carboxylase] ligase